MSGITFGDNAAQLGKGEPVIMRVTTADTYWKPAGGANLGFTGAEPVRNTASLARGGTPAARLDA